MGFKFCSQRQNKNTEYGKTKQTTHSQKDNEPKKKPKKHMQRLRHTHRKPLRTKLKTIIRKQKSSKIKQNKIGTG